MDIDRQRITAVRALEALGYVYRGGEWQAPAGAAATPLPFLAKADAMLGALMRRADALAGCTEGRPTGPSAGRSAKTRTCREGLVAGIPWHGYGCKLANEGRSTPKADSLRLTLCATSLTDINNSRISAPSPSVDGPHSDPPARRVRRPYRP
jgi:hypothetical protein